MKVAVEIGGDCVVEVKDPENEVEVHQAVDAVLGSTSLDAWWIRSHEIVSELHPPRNRGEGSRTDERQAAS